MTINYTRTLDPDVDLDADITSALNAKVAAHNADPANADNQITVASLIAATVDSVLTMWAKAYTDQRVDERAALVKAGPRALRLQLETIVDNALSQQ